MIPVPICILLIFAFGVWAIALYSRRRCIRCGKNRAGRMAGGTVDDPVCFECVEKERREAEGVAA